MIAVLLAAGKGKRTGEIGKKKQKASFLLEHNLSVLGKYFDKIFIIVGHRKEDVVRIVAKSRKEVKEKIAVIEQKKLLGNANAVSLVEEYVKEPFIVANGDILLKENYLDKLLKCNPPALAISVVDDPWNYGVIRVEKSHVTGIVEKPVKGEEPSNLIISGFYYFTPDIFKAIAQTPLNEKKQEYDLTDSMLLLLKHMKIETALIEKPKHIITKEDITKILEEKTKK